MDQLESNLLEEEYKALLQSLFDILRSDVNFGDRTRDSAKALAEMIKARLGIEDQNESEGWVGSNFCSF